jgi:hypothetical protein
MVRWTPVELQLRERRLNAPAPLQSLEFTVPIKIESEMNKRDHWAVRKKRFDAQRTAVWAAWPRKRGKPQTLPLPVVVTLTRIGKRRLDDDNCAGGCKAVRDQIAMMLGVDDGDVNRVTWVYEQEIGKVYALHVRIATRS